MQNLTVLPGGKAALNQCDVHVPIVEQTQVFDGPGRIDQVDLHPLRPQQTLIPFRISVIGPALRPGREANVLRRGRVHQHQGGDQANRGNRDQRPVHFEEIPPT